MVYQALRSGFPARAAAVFGAFTDLEGMLAATKGLEMARKIWPAELEQDRKALVERRSALRWPERISAPVLISQGGADQSVSVEHSFRLAKALEAAKKPYRLLVIGGGNHPIDGSRQLFFDEADRLFRSTFEDD